MFLPHLSPSLWPIPADMKLAHSCKYAWRRSYLHICYFSSCLPKSFSSSSLNQTRTRPPISGILLANLICFYILNNHVVVQNVSKKDQSDGCVLWMCCSCLSRVALHVCLLFIQAVCAEKAGVSAHAALPLQECRAKESWRERNGTHAEPSLCMCQR